MERLKGRGRKEVNFRRMGGWKKTERTITPMFKRFFSAPMTPHTGSSLKSGSGALWLFSPQAHF